MRFADERYFRLYTRDTTTWVLMSWQARAILPLIGRKMDRAGCLDLGEDGTEGLAALLLVPVEVVRAGLDGPNGLLERRVLEIHDGVLVWPRYIEAQEAKQSDRARSRAARERVRDRTRAASRGVAAPTHDVTEAGSREAGKELAADVGTGAGFATDEELAARSAVTWRGGTDTRRDGTDGPRTEPSHDDAREHRTAESTIVPSITEPRAGILVQGTVTWRGDTDTRRDGTDGPRTEPSHDDTSRHSRAGAGAGAGTDPSLTLPREGTTLEQALQILRTCRDDDDDLLHDEAERRLLDAGFQCAREFEVADRGDGRRGFVDLVATGDHVVLAIELNRDGVREKSIRKLQAVPNAVRVVVLCASIGVADVPAGLDHVVALGTAKQPTARLDPSFGLAAYHEGAQAGLRTATGKADARLPSFGWHAGAEVERLLEAHAPTGLDDQGRLEWLRAKAEAYVVATYAEAKYQRGFAPGRCADWVTAGCPPTRGAPGVTRAASATADTVVSPSRMPIGLLRAGSAA